MDTNTKSETHQGLPVSGYRPQTASKVAMVNNFKEIEENILQTLDKMKNGEEIDQCWLAIGRTKLEEAFMAINRSVFRPDRVTLSR